MIKMRWPAGRTSFSHEGHDVTAGADGSVLVPERFERDFASHGFTLWDAPAPEADDPRRAALMERVGKMSTDDIESLLELASEKPVSRPLSLPARGKA